MQAGDLVRFTPNDDWRKRDLPNWKYGLLVEYKPWEKIARILHKGRVVSVHAMYCQLAIRHPGEKDESR